MNDPLFYKIIGGTISLLLVVIGFFLVRYIKQQDDTNRELTKSVNKLTTAITGLSGSVIRQEERHNDFKKEYDEHIYDYHKSA